MRITSLALTLAAAAAAPLAACGGDDAAKADGSVGPTIDSGTPGPDAPVGPTIDSGIPPGTPDSGVNCSPVQGIPTLGLQEIANNLQEPTASAVAPGSRRIFVTERPGLIRIIDENDNLLATPFLDLTAIVQDNQNERGLLGLAFHPQYAQNGRFYVHYTADNGDVKLAQYKVSANPNVADPQSGVVLLTQAHPLNNHNGGWLAFGPDGYLYEAFGDGGSGGDPDENGQKLTTYLAKILRLDVNTDGMAKPAAGNPFIGMGNGVKEEIFIYGVRNPWRSSFDRQTWALYIADVGQDYMEEVNYLPWGTAGGANLGWDIMEGTSCFNDTGQNGWPNPLPPTCTMTGLTLPIHTYLHFDPSPNGNTSASVVGGYVYRGCKMPALAGTYFYGDTADRYIKSFRYDGATKSDEKDYPTLNGKIIYSFGEDPDGELLVLDGGGGRVYRIVPQ